MNRRSTDCGWITRWMAEHADVRSLGDAVAFIGCGALFAALVGFALYIGGVR